MSLTIKISTASQAHDLATWSQLGVYDLTRSSREQEESLIRSLSRDSAGKISWVEDEQGPILRCFVTAIEKDKTFSMGFLAFAPRVDESVLRDALLQLLAALQKSFAQPMQNLIAPMNGNTWFPYRVRTDHHDLQFDWEPPRDPLLEKLLKEVGFKEHAHYHSTAATGLKKMASELQKDWERVVHRGIQVKAASVADLRGPLLHDLYQLTQKGFAENPFFVSISFEAFAQNYVQGKTERENFLFTACEPGGRCIAFVLCFLEPAQQGRKKTLILKSAATEPAYRQQGLCNALVYAICQELPEGISDEYYTALVFSGWTSESYARHGEFLWQHEYVLLSRDMEGTPG